MTDSSLKMLKVVTYERFSLNRTRSTCPLKHGFLGFHGFSQSKIGIRFRF